MPSKTNRGARTSSRKILTSSALLFLLVTFELLPSANANDGMALLREKKPRFYSLLARHLGSHSLEQFLGRFIEKHELRQIDILFDEKLKTRGQVAGALVELAAVSVMREMGIEREGIFMTERAYRLRNTEGTAPDGLVYHINSIETGSFIVIKGVVEAKLTYKTLQTSQLKEYLAHWKNEGVVAGDLKKDHSFLPDQIFLENENGVLIPIANVTPDVLEKVSVIVTTERERYGNWGHHRVPFSSYQADQFATSYLKMKGRDIAPGEHRDDRSFTSRINQFVLSQQRPPRRSRSEREEASLEMEVLLRGGWEDVFVHYLWSESRHLMVERGYVPPYDETLRTLLSLDPDSLNAIPSLRSFLRFFHASFPEQGTPPIVLRLSAAQAAWRSYFAENDWKELLKPDPSVEKKCARWLSATVTEVPATDTPGA